MIHRSENCSLSVVGIGEYHSGGNARKKKNKKIVLKRNRERENSRVVLFLFLGKV